MIYFQRILESMVKRWCKTIKKPCGVSQADLGLNLISNDQADRHGEAGKENLKEKCVFKLSVFP